MPGPENVIVGNQGFPTDLPQTQVPEADLSREKNMARFSQTDEFKALKAAIEGRIKFYQNYMPGSSNTPIAHLPNEERGYMWLASSVIIDEFNSILGAYETAAEAVKDHAAS